MTKKISPKIIDTVASLARLNLSKEEEKVAAEELGRILGYIDRLAEVDTENVVPYASPAVTFGKLRADVTVPFTNRKQLLSGDSFHDDLLVTRGIFSDNDDGE